ncbi:CRISPR-associated protein Cas4 [Desulforamulus ruminis]|uniref:CRISPR-associated protein Cas4 n=1 Tax=Desulforamulus ruminis TaxID=1564 RepID=UPI002FDAA0B4
MDKKPAFYGVPEDEDSYLMLSGIQHFFFCKRQWGLIHLEQAWAENVRTVEGRHMHERVDDPFNMEKRGDLIIARSMALSSKTLGLYGVADVVEFRLCEEQTTANGVSIPGRAGRWLPRPVEYKRGKPKKDERDIVQLCAQALCLEEMFGACVAEGDMYYGEIRRRQSISFTKQLREQVRQLALAMHDLFVKGITPPAEKSAKCRQCSLMELCMPKLAQKSRRVDVYVKKMLSSIDDGEG